MTELEKSISMYFGIEADLLEHVASRFRHESLNKGDFFTRSGQLCDKLSFIRTGYLRIYTDKGQKEVTQWVSSPGYFVTELTGLFFSQRSRWHIQAITDCELYTIRGKNYHELQTDIPQWHEIEKLFIAKCFTILEDRVFSFLSKTAEERYVMLSENHKDLFLEVPQHYLASMIGMTPETFSRLRKKIR